MGRYIIFKTETADAEGWDDRQLMPNGSLTDILAEYYDASQRPLPQPGYRLRDYVRVESAIDPQFPAASTHSRLSNWQVTRVEVYEPREMGSAFEAIAVCFCQWVPIAAPIEPLPAIESPALNPA